jgi:predicted secreted Zn-dependent protease
MTRYRLIRKLCAIVFIALYCSQAHSSEPRFGPFDEFLAGVPSSVRRAYADENWAYVLARSQPAAEKGNAHAQTMMGLLYYFGHGVKQSYSEAERWYQLAAEQEHSVALANLADIYNEGLGVKVDYEKAHKLWKRAAGRGNTMAMYNLGRHHLTGIGVPADFCEAYYWWTRAARLGGGLAQDQLSVMFARGDGVAQDKLQAYIWSKLAEKYLESESDRAIAAKRSEKLAREITEQQLSQAQDLITRRTLTELASALPTCSPQVYRYTIQHDIAGLTTNELASQSYKHGPQLEGKRYAGPVFSNVAYYVPRSVGLECTVTALQTEVVVVSFEPRLLNPEKTPSQLVERFSNYLDTLHRFHEGYSDIAIDFAKKFKDEASRLPPAATCKELEKSLADLFKTMGATYSERQRKWNKQWREATRFPRKGRIGNLAEHIGVIATLSAKKVRSMISSAL